MEVKNSYILLVTILLIFSIQVEGAEIRRLHKFPRAIAMGDAFIAVADSKESVAYNPAGLLSKGMDWSLTFPVFGLAYNDVVKQSMNGELDIDFSDPASYSSLPGKRIYLELDTIPLVNVILPQLYMPDLGIYTGFSSDFWVDIAFPKPMILPVVHLELIAQGVFEYAKSFEIYGFNAGYNIKIIQRTGVDADVSLLRSSFEAQDIIDEYASEQPQPKLSVDFGLLYRFDHPWNWRIGLSALDAASLDLGGDFEVKTGGIDYGSAGEVKMINSFGLAFTKDIREFYFTGAVDFQDYTFSYFSNESYKRRLVFGFEAAYGKRSDDEYMIALQCGIRELKYPSFGLAVNIGVLEINTIYWVENFGTEENEQLDTRQMLTFAVTL